MPSCLRVIIQGCACYLDNKTSIWITFIFFRHFDKDKTGYLDHQEFKSCLRSLGYDLSIVEEGEEDPEFQAILRTVDPNG